MDFAGLPAAERGPAHHRCVSRFLPLNIHGEWGAAPGGTAAAPLRGALLNLCGGQDLPLPSLRLHSCCAGRESGGRQQECEQERLPQGCAKALQCRSPPTPTPAVAAAAAAAAATFLGTLRRSFLSPSWRA